MGRKCICLDISRVHAYCRRAQQYFWKASSHAKLHRFLHRRRCSCGIRTFHKFFDCSTRCARRPTFVPPTDCSKLDVSAVQGTGGGGIIALTEIIIADLVPLRERGKYSGIIAAVRFWRMVLGPWLLTILSRCGRWHR